MINEGQGAAEVGQVANGNVFFFSERVSPLNQDARDQHRQKRGGTRTALETALGGADGAVPLRPEGAVVYQSDGVRFGRAHVYLAGQLKKPGTKERVVTHTDPRGEVVRGYWGQVLQSRIRPNRVAREVALPSPHTT